MPTTSNIADQNVYFSQLSDDLFLYKGVTSRDITAYPLTQAGQAAFEAAVALGNHTGITVDGILIPAGTVPPLVKPTLNPPTGLSATVVSATAINLAWDSVAGAVSYQVDRSLTGSSGWSQVGTSATNSFADSGLTALTPYFYRVRSVNAGGSISGNSATANATTSSASYPAYSKKIQAEDASASNIPYSGGSSADGVTREYGNNSSHYIEWASIPDAPVSDSNYTITIPFKTTSETVDSTITLIINSQSFTVTLPHTGGSLNPLVLTGKALQKGTNTIRIQGVSGNFGIDYILISHPASS